MTGLLPARVVRRVGTAVTWHGLLIGFVSAIGSIIQALFFTPDPLGMLFNWTIITFFPFPMLAGWVGARRGLGILMDKERIYYASQAVLHAHTSDAIVNAIATYLIDAQLVRLGLWDVLLQDKNGVPTAVSLRASWQTKSVDPWESGIQLTQETDAALTNLQLDNPYLLKIEDLPDTQQDLWHEPLVRSVLFLPLITPGGNWAGILTVSSKSASGFSRSSEQDYVTIGAQVALVLDNMRLVAQAKETAVLHERQRMAREIHDTLAQGFTSIVMHLEAAEQAVPQDLDTVQHHLDQARHTARESLGQARSVVDDLRPDVLQSRPLHEAIERVVRTWSRRSQIESTFQATGDICALHPEVEVTLLRSVQEALSNIRKHAQATSVCVTLTYLGDVVILDVEDNGVGLGFAPRPTGELKSSGFGLVAMRERIEALGGELSLESEPGEGTTVAVSIPMSRTEKKVQHE
ncbi:MAG: GAF domain-containing sensor histidine kinase [Chloroflexi bacterium]|nr:GAF domain-containing sensor histidine kinase [Chloroflexota bacterium]